MDGLAGPFSGTQDLHENMRKVRAAVQANGYAERQAVVQRFTDIICGQNHNVDVECYGSSFTGLFVKESDVDLVIIVPAYQLQNDPEAFLTKIYNQLMAGRRAWRLNEVKINTAAPIPFVKAVDSRSGLDVSFTCAELAGRTTVLENSEWIHSAACQYPAVATLVVVLKTLLCKKYGLPNIGAGGISSYALVLMVISYMQHADRQDNFGDLLLGFLVFYGYDFDYENKAIVLTNGGRIVDKGRLQGMMDPLGDQLIIQDPVDPTKNAAKQSLGGLDSVRKAFKTEYESLKRQLSGPDKLPALLLLLALLLFPLWVLTDQNSKNGL